MKISVFIIAVICLLTVNIAGSAKESITGKVFDEKKHPLENVGVSVKGYNRLAKTNFDGWFKIEVDSF